METAEEAQAQLFCGNALRDFFFAQVVSNKRFRSNLVQVIGRPSTYCIPVRKCVTTIVQQIQLFVRILNVIGM